MVWQRHGALGYSVGMFFCCWWWCRQFGEAEACPNSAFEELALHAVNPFAGRTAVRLLAQLLGAFLTAK